MENCVESEYNLNNNKKDTQSENNYKVFYKNNNKNI